MKYATRNNPLYPLSHSIISSQTTTSWTCVIGQHLKGDSVARKIWHFILCVVRPQTSLTILRSSMKRDNFVPSHYTFCLMISRNLLRGTHHFGYTRVYSVVAPLQESPIPPVLQSAEHQFLALPQSCIYCKFGMKNMGLYNLLYVHIQILSCSCVFLLLRAAYNNI